MKDLLWLIPLFPLLGAIVNGLVGNRRGWEHRTTSAIALVGSGLAMAGRLRGDHRLGNDPGHPRGACHSGVHVDPTRARPHLGRDARRPHY